LNIKNLFENWLNGIDKKTKARIHVGVYALLRAMWNFCNDVIFNMAGRAHFSGCTHGYLLKDHIEPHVWFW
jgi:hypothetical protein